LGFPLEALYYKNQLGTLRITQLRTWKYRRIFDSGNQYRDGFVDRTI